MSHLFSWVEEASDEPALAELLQEQPTVKVLVGRYSASGSLELLSVRQGMLHLEEFRSGQQLTSRKFNHDEQLDLSSITDYFSVNNSLFFVGSPAISVSMCLAGTDCIVRAKFPQEFTVEEGCSINSAFPSIHIFGGRLQDKSVSSDFLELNLMTYQVSNHSKEGGYGPEPRYNHLSYMRDDRLYVWGGLGKDSTPVADGLLWTYDFEKSYWFALELSTPIALERTLLRIVEREPNKLCLVNVRDAGVYALDIFQCTVR